MDLIITPLLLSHWPPDCSRNWSLQPCRRFAANGNYYDVLFFRSFFMELQGLILPAQYDDDDDDDDDDDEEEQEEDYEGEECTTNLFHEDV